MKNRKIIVVITGVIVIFILSLIWINDKYLYTPFTYPKGLISEYTHYSFIDFKKPIFIEGIREDADRLRWLSHYVTEEQAVNNVLQHFDQAFELKNFDQKRIWQAGEPFLPVYEVIIRKVESWEGGNSIATGEILIQFRFYEDEDFFFIGDRYFELSDDLKNAIMEPFAEVEWYLW